MGVPWPFSSRQFPLLRNYDRIEHAPAWQSYVNLVTILSVPISYLVHEPCLEVVYIWLLFVGAEVKCFCPKCWFILQRHNTCRKKLLVLRQHVYTRELLSCLRSVGVLFRLKNLGSIFTFVWSIDKIQFYLCLWWAIETRNK